MNRWLNNPKITKLLEYIIKASSNLLKATKIKKDTIEISDKLNFVDFFLSPSGFENDIFEYLTFVTIKNDEAIIMGRRSLGSEYWGLVNLTLSTYIINEHMNMALKVVGNPLKYDIPSPSETLNWARRITPNSKGANAMTSPEIPGIFWEYSIYTSIDGARQKETRSTKESNSFPNSLETPSALATAPSNESKIAAINIK